jgi:hypothetical protein
MKKKLEMETKEFEYRIIPKYKKKYEEIESKLSITVAEFTEMEKEREKYRNLWHQEVDAIFDRVGYSMTSMRENHLAALKSYQSKINDCIQDMVKIVQQNKMIMSSNKVSEIMSYNSKLEEFATIPSEIDINLPSLKSIMVEGKELSLEFENYKTSLTQTTMSSVTEKRSHLSLQKLLNQDKLITAIPIGCIYQCHVACVGVNEVWFVGTDKTIRRVDIHGSILDTVDTKCQTWPDDITVTRHGELLYSDGSTGSVYIIRRGIIETLIITPRGWIAQKLCCTRSGDILVSMYNRRFKIVRYQGNVVTQEIDRDEYGVPIYNGWHSYLYIGENNNGDVCASDESAGTVVVVNKSGRVRFRYDGAPARRKKPFDPRHIVTDSMSQILVADCNNDCIHILDQNGEFVRCIDNCGLVKPFGLSVDNKERLWVGLLESGELKVIRYTYME